MHVRKRRRGLGRGAVGALLAILVLSVVPDLTAASRSPAPGWRPLTADLAAAASAEYLTITAKAGEGAWITPEGPVKVPYGGSQTFDFGAAAGHHLTGLYIDGVAKSTTATSVEFVDVTADHLIEVLAAPDTFTIRASAGPGGSMTPAGDVSVPYGGGQTFEFVADAGYHVSELLIDGATHYPAISPYTFSDVTRDRTIEVRFARDDGVPCSITASASEGGSIEPSGTVTVPFGGARSFTYTPAPYYRLADVVVDGLSKGPLASPYRFTNVISNRTIAVRFERDPAWFRIGTVVSGGGHGRIIPLGDVPVSVNGDIWVPRGSDQELRVVPDLGYGVHWVAVDGKDAGHETVCRFAAVDADHTVVAAFAPDPVTITARAGAGGSIEPSGTITVPLHDARGFTIKADAGHVLELLTVDGVAQPPASQYTFFDVVEDHTIVATFVPADTTAPEVVMDPYLKSESDRRVFPVHPTKRQVFAFVVIENAGGSGISIPRTVAYVRTPAGHWESLELEPRPYVTSDGLSAVCFLGRLPVAVAGKHLVRATGRDMAGNSADAWGYYRVGGTAEMKGAPGRIDLSDGKQAEESRGGHAYAARAASPGAGPVTLTLRIRSASGRPVSGARPRLYAYDLTSGTRLFRAETRFRARGAGVYTYRWFPARMTYDAAWGHEWRPVQLLVPLDDRALPKGRLGAAHAGGHAAKTPARPTLAATTIQVRW